MTIEKILWLGSSQTGKTALIACLQGRPFESSTNPTMGIDHYDTRISSLLSVKYIDTAGQSRFVSSEVPAYIKNAHQICLVYRSDCKASFEYVKALYAEYGSGFEAGVEWNSEISRCARDDVGGGRDDVGGGRDDVREGREGVGKNRDSVRFGSTTQLILIKTHTDREQLHVLDEEADHFAQKNGMTFFKVSSKTGAGIDDLQDYFYLQAHQRQYILSSIKHPLHDLIKIEPSAKVKLALYELLAALPVFVALSHEEQAAYFRDNQALLDKQFNHMYQLNPGVFNQAYQLCSHLWTTCGLEVDRMPCSVRYQAQYAIQEMKNLITPKNTIQNNLALRKISQHLESALSASDPHVYFDKHANTLKNQLSILQRASSSMFNSVCNIMIAFFCSCITLFCRPIWLEDILRHNREERVDNYMFFSFGLKQQAQCQAQRIQKHIIRAHEEMSEPMKFCDM